LVAAQVDFVVGSMLSPTLEQRSKGFVGYSENNYKENLWSAYTTNEQVFIAKFNISLDIIQLFVISWPLNFMFKD